MGQEEAAGEFVAEERLERGIAPEGGNNKNSSRHALKLVEADTVGIAIVERHWRMDRKCAKASIEAMVEIGPKFPPKGGVQRQK